MGHARAIRSRARARARRGAARRGAARSTATRASMSGELETRTDTSTPPTPTRRIESNERCDHTKSSRRATRAPSRDATIERGRRRPARALAA